jgi:predicted metal-dependent phosphoesterase TrpH
MNIDFHIHSKYSFDSFLEPIKIVEMARARGLDGLAIADHDTMAGIEEFRRIAPDLYIIAGEELITDIGDIVGIFLKRPIKPSKNPDEVIREIRAQGGLAYLAHPYKWPFLNRDAAILKRFDAVEVFNARNNIPSPLLCNWKCSRAARLHHLPVVAGSDTHEGFELGMARTIFDFNREEATDEKIKKAILERNVRVEGREVSLMAEVFSHFTRMVKSWGANR